MFLFFVALFILVPIVEITVLLQVSDLIGGWNAIGLIVAISFFGAWLMRHEGFIVMRKIREQTEQGNVPSNELIDGFLVLVGGLMMLTPGFVTDGLGLLLVFPLSRIAIRTLVRRRFVHRFDFVTRIPYGQDLGRSGPGRNASRRRNSGNDDDIIDL